MLAQQRVQQLRSEQMNQMVTNIDNVCRDKYQVILIRIMRGVFSLYYIIQNQNLITGNLGVMIAIIIKRNNNDYNKKNNMSQIRKEANNNFMNKK
jgi:hypothetical protein